jgi:hypothetical protein
VKLWYSNDKSKERNTLQGYFITENTCSILDMILKLDENEMILWADHYMVSKG